MATLSAYGPSCGVTCMDGVGNATPEACMKALTRQQYDYTTGKYHSGGYFHSYGHVIFSAPDTATYKGAKRFADYIEAHGLGLVTRAPNKNPVHASRKEDLVVYVWAVNKEAVEKWFKDEKEGTLTDKVVKKAKRVVKRVKKD